MGVDDARVEVSSSEVVVRLDAEYDQETGFLGQLRAGVFDPAAYERFVGLLQGIEVEGDVFDRRFVELLWYVPLFMDWQTGRVEERSGMPPDEYMNYKNKVLALLEGILGVP